MTGLLTEPARPRLVREHRWAPWFAVGAVCFGAFMGQLDASVVTLAFPTLQRQFTTGLAAVQWVSLAYLLTLVALLVPVGRWSDRAGRKLVYLYGFVVFTAASAVCGLAGSLRMLVVVRAVQAAGAAMLQANSVALVATSVPPARRRAALGVQAAAQSLGLAVGPTAGGLMVASVGWRWIFLVNVPVGVVAVVAGVFLLPRTRHRAGEGGSDAGGVVLLGCAAAALLVALSSVSGLALPRPVAVGLAVLAMASAGGLVWWERRARTPLLDVRLLASRGVDIGLAGALAAYMVLFGPLVLFAQTLGGHTANALRAGIVLTALPAGFGLAAVAGERLLPRGWPDRCRCVAGGLVAAAAAAGLAVPGLPAGMALSLLGLLGLGLGTFIPANNAVVMGAVPASQAAATGGMVNMARGLGTAFGVAVVALALHLGARQGHPGEGVPLTMAVLAAVALLAAATGRAAGTGPHHGTKPGRPSNPVEHPVGEEYPR